MVASKLTPEERLIKKRQAARLRQQRCRQRKRERAAAAEALAKGGVAPSAASLDAASDAGVAIAPAAKVHLQAYSNPAHAQPPLAPAGISAADAAYLASVRAARSHPQHPYALGAAAAHARAHGSPPQDQPGSLSVPPVSPSPPPHGGVPRRDSHAQPPLASGGQGKEDPLRGQEKEAVDAILALAGPGPNGTPPMPPLDAPSAAAEMGSLNLPPPPVMPPHRAHEVDRARAEASAAARYERERHYAPGAYAPPYHHAEDELYPHVRQSHQQSAHYPGAPAHAPQGAASAPSMRPQDREFLLREDRLREEMLALRHAERRLAAQQHELEQRRYRHQQEARQRHQQHLDYEYSSKAVAPPPPSSCSSSRGRYGAWAGCTTD